MYTFRTRGGSAKNGLPKIRVPNCQNEHAILRGVFSANFFFGPLYHVDDKTFAMRVVKCLQWALTTLCGRAFHAARAATINSSVVIGQAAPTRSASSFQIGSIMFMSALYGGQSSIHWIRFLLRYAFVDFATCDRAPSCCHGLFKSHALCVQIAPCSSI